MFALARIFLGSIFVGLIGSVVAIGAVGLLSGIPLAFLEVLPGDDFAELRQLPRSLLVAGFGGLVVGTMAGMASQLTGQRVGYVSSVVIVSAFTLLTIYWTHPGLNLNIDSGIGDYLESYRLTVLACLGGAIMVVVAGWLLRPFRRSKRADRISTQ